MPSMDGFTASKKIRAFNTKVPIIALSAAVMERDKELSLESGMNEHLAKPIKMQELELILKKYLKNKPKKDIEIEDKKASRNFEIYGVDTNKLVKELGLSPETLCPLFLEFTKTYEYLGKNLDFQNDEKNSYMLIHKLRGASGNLRIAKIYELSSKIDDNKELSLVDELIKELEKTILSIKEEFGVH